MNQDLGRHVVGRATKRESFVLHQDLREAEVNELDFPRRREHDILWLQVPMRTAEVAKVRERSDDARRIDARVA